MYLPAVNIKVSIYIVQGYKKGYRNSTRNCNFANVYLFNNLCKNFLASIAAWRIGRSFAVRCLFPWLCESSLLSLRSLVSSGLVLSPLSSEHSKGYRKFNALFSSFPDDVLTVAARTSLSWLVISASIFPNFQLPLNELSLRSTTSPFEGWTADWILGVFNVFWVLSRRLSTYSLNHSFQNMSRCFCPSRHVSRSFWEELILSRKSGSCSRSAVSRWCIPVFGFRLRKWAGVSVNPEFRSAPTYTNGLQLSTASGLFGTVWRLWLSERQFHKAHETFVKTGWRLWLSERQFHKAHETFVKTSHPGC